ncbi:PEP/pyruvate-binding domain-containing protein [Oscillatoria amoena NRMC-F 0135]|nr:PEP/pyruvate-binding domain-containing protein [Oscillatoria amoena NRMC-F 0135]
MSSPHADSIHPQNLHDTNWIVPLGECRNAARVGGKAVNLGELIRAGFNVPDGFVITTDAYERARSPDGLPSAALVSEIRRAYVGIGAARVAVRSSATAEDLPTASMAGQYETFLDVQDEPGLLARIQDCWNSIHSPRTRAYLDEHGLQPEQVRMAVVVQRLVPATVAGVAFSIDPRSGRQDRIVIEASWGLGESVVSGSVQPDTLVLARDDGRVVEAGIAVNASGGRACLTSPQVHHIWKMVRRIESHFGSPQDIEWAFDGQRLFILQSRAITTPCCIDRGALIHDIQLELGSMLDRGQGPWVLHNLAETLPHPTPLTWSIMRRFLSGEGGFGNLYRMVGFEPGPRVRDAGIADLIAGRIYMDLSRSPDLFMDGFPFAYDTAKIISDPNAGQAPPTMPTGTFARRLRAQQLLQRVDRRLDELAGTWLTVLESNLVPEFERWVRAQEQIDLAVLSTGSLLALWPQWHDRVMQEFGPQSLLPSMIVGHLQAKLHSLLEEHLWNESTPAAIQHFSAGSSADKTLEANEALYQVGTGELEVSAWLETFGHRAPNELELAAPRWQERPDDVIRLAAQLKSGARPAARHAIQHSASDAARTQLRALLPKRDHRSFDLLVDRLQQYLPYRESGKFHWMRGYALLRKWAVEAGRRLGVGDDVAFLTETELLAAVKLGYAPMTLIEQRRDHHATMTQFPAPTWIDRASMASIGSATLPPAPADAMRGFAISPGRGNGTVCIATAPTDTIHPSQGYVLVCRSTDPSWTPLFVNAAALVFEVGGSLSHGSIVAREMGVPAVVVPNATQLLRSGQQVTVDGDRGLVITDEAVDNAPASAVNDLPMPEIPPARRPPVVSRLESRRARLRNTCAIGWVVLIVAAFLLPPAWLYEPAMGVLDATLWPIMRSLGTAWGTAVLAGAIAVGTMVLQRILTDHHRLSAAKRRAQQLQDELKSLDPKSAMARHIRQLTQPVQYRLLGAAMVPLGLLLGPLVLVFLWLPARVDPAVTPPAPGSRIVVKAEVDGDWVTPIRLAADSVRLPLGIDATQQVRPIRGALISLRREWSTAAGDPSLPWHVSAAGDVTREQLIADLDRFLEQPIPTQSIAWPAVLPDREGVYTISLQTVDHPPIELRVAAGHETLPQPTISQFPTGPVREVSIVYPGKRPAELIFLAPFAQWGWGFDIGWLGVYLLAYVPLMFLSKLLLRVP